MSCVPPLWLLCYDFAMQDILNLAFSKAAALPKDAQEKLARDLLDRIETLSRLGEIDAGLAELDAGQGKPLDVEQLIWEERERHGEV